MILYVKDATVASAFQKSGCATMSLIVIIARTKKTASGKSREPAGQKSSRAAMEIVFWYVHAALYIFNWPLVYSEKYFQAQSSNCFLAVA